MRLAAIDIGTNSLHMIVVQVQPDLSFEVIDREKQMVRLGAGGLDGRALTPEAMKSVPSCCAAVMSFDHSASKLALDCGAAAAKTAGAMAKISATRTSRGV